MMRSANWTTLRATLEALQRSVVEEIRAYPFPITACDAQFNRLLELRRLLPEELARLDAAGTDASASIDAFVHASPCRAEIAAAVAAIV
jgi:hypothetical protein